MSGFNNNFYLMLDSAGIIRGLSSQGKKPPAFGIGGIWNEIWPDNHLCEGAQFAFKQADVLWHVEVEAIKDGAEKILSYIVKCKDMPDNNGPVNEKELTKLKQKVEFYERIIDNSCDEMFVTDGQGKIIFVNPVCENHYGIPISDLLGKSVWELEERGIYHPAVTPMVFREKKKITIDQETAIGKKLMVTATPLFDKNDQIELVICNSRDVTALEDMKRNYLEMREKVHQTQTTGNKIKTKKDVQLIYNDNSPLSELMQMAHRIAKTESIALLQGETGTGKDLFARQIHDLSPRNDKHFLKVNCAALPQELLESELFGYKSGAFTGASAKGKIGQFAIADRGTIFLDEIGEIPLSLQPKLLQVIEEQKFTPIGSSSVAEIDVRIIASTNRDLKSMINNGQFREDLYYRLCVLAITIPPLRDRVEDVPLLVEHYRNIFNENHKRSIDISQEAMEYLIAYCWPGNVRELEHLIEYLIVTATSVRIKPEHLPPHITATLNEPVSLQQGHQSLQAAIEDLERIIIVNCYKKLKSSYKVALKLGISQSSAIRKIRKYVEH